MQVVETTRGQALADEYSIKFFETSAKNNINVVESFTAIATDIKKRLMDNPGASAPPGSIRIDSSNASGSKKAGCCKVCALSQSRLSSFMCLLVVSFVPQ